MTELVFSVLRKIPPEDAFSLSKTLASRGFVFGTKENNLLKPFKHSADSPICINLNKIEPSFATLLESIAEKIEHDRFNKVKFSFNSGQLLQLSNMNLECVRQTMEAVICQEYSAQCECEKKEYWAVDDFSDKREIIREAISNAIDANKQNILINVKIDENDELMTIRLQMTEMG